VSEPPSVIIVDDEKHVRLSSAQTLELEGFRVATFARAHDALLHLSAAYPGMVISDIRMPGMDGMAFLDRVVEIDPHLPVALITGHGDVALAVKAMRAGAYDFIEKPFEGEHLIEMVRRALEMRRLVLENRSLRHALAGDDELGRRLIGRSDATERLRHEIEALADAEADVLILGETGTGKELVARLLHDVGPRRDRPFVAINCGALPETITDCTSSLHVAVGQVAVAFDHLKGLVAEHFGDLQRVRAVHGEIARRGVAQVMEPKIPDAGGIAMRSPRLCECQWGQGRLGAETASEPEASLPSRHRRL